MNTLNNLIKKNQVFSQLNEPTLNSLLLKFNPFPLKKGEVLFYQGGPSDSVFFLTQGKLSAEFTLSTGEIRVIGHIDEGELVGELGVLSNEPRSLTIKAIKESLLYRLSSEDFIELCNQFPSVMYATVHPVLQRSKSILHLLAKKKPIQHIVITPANGEVNLEKFSEKLFPLCEDFRRTILVSDYDPTFREKDLDREKIKEKIHQFEESKKSIYRVIYILRSHDTYLARYALKKATMIYVVGDSQCSPKIDNHILDKLKSNRLQLLTEPELIILHNDNAMTPANTFAWLSQAEFGLQHHVRPHSQKDLHRLLRFIRGKAVGVVLSGGGTRGWAHLGAIKALKDSKIPIDIIGGTSVGAIIAACYAWHASYEEAFDKFYGIVEASNHSVSWRNLTWPSVSLFNAESFTQSQIDIFGNQRIENLWLPYFCISCNLATNTEDIHRSGIVWEKTRASSSLPGIIPPMLINGELHLDGGLMNNLPVDIMRQLIRSRGKIIAVDLNRYSPNPTKYNFPPSLTFKDALHSFLGLNKKKYKYPGFMDTFLQGLFIGSLAKSKQNSLSANIFISPDLSKFRILHSNSKQREKLIEIGYEETLRKCARQTTQSSNTD